MTAAWLLSWWNLIFIVPFFLALVYLGVYTFSGWTLGGDFDADHGVDADHDLAVDHDADVGVDHDADLDHDADVAADADADADGHADAGHHGDGHPEIHAEAAHHDASHAVPAHVALMTWLGVGRVPVGLVLMVLLLSWGFIGFITNQLTRPVVPADWMVGLISLPVALFGSGFVTRNVTRFIATYMPLTETSARSRAALIGQVGEAMYEIDRNFGMASVRVHTGVFHVPCRVGQDGAPIVKGAPVMLVAYDHERGLFTVIPYELGGDSQRAIAAGNGNGKARQQS